VADDAALGSHDITEGQTPGVEEYWIQSCSSTFWSEREEGYLNYFTAKLL
jgi:hypothetical protein